MNFIKSCWASASVIMASRFVRSLLSLSRATIAVQLYDSSSNRWCIVRAQNCAGTARSWLTFFYCIFLAGFRRDYRAVIRFGSVPAVSSSCQKSLWVRPVRCYSWRILIVSTHREKWPSNYYFPRNSPIEVLLSDEGWRCVKWTRFNLRSNK